MRNIPLGGPIKPTRKSKGKAPARAPPPSKPAARSFVDDEASSGPDEPNTSDSDSGSAWDESDEGPSDSSDDARTPRGSRAAAAEAESDLSFTDEEDQSHSSDDDFAPNERDTFSLATGKARGKKRVKGWPGPKWQLKKWRRVAPEERDAVTGEGGLVWREAQHILNEHSRKDQDVLKLLLQRALSRTDASLTKERIPREPRLPTSVVSAAAGGWGAATNAAVAGGGESSLVAWKMEEQGDLAGLFDGDDDRENKVNGFDGEIADMERVLLPEAEQTAHLFSAREQQDRVITRLRAVRDRLRRELDDTGQASGSELNIYRQLYPTALADTTIQEGEDREEIADDAVAAATQEAVDAGAEIEEDENESRSVEPTVEANAASNSPETEAHEIIRNEATEESQRASRSPAGPQSHSPRGKRRSQTPRSVRSRRLDPSVPKNDGNQRSEVEQNLEPADGSLTSPLGLRSTRNTSHVSHLPDGPMSRNARLQRQASSESSLAETREAPETAVDSPPIEAAGNSGFFSSIAERLLGSFTADSSSR